MADHAALSPNLGFDRTGRDAQRTPMQWSADPAGGFTDGTPWLPPFDPETTNVVAQRGDPHSLLSLYHNLIQLRAQHPALRLGTQRSLFNCGPDIIAWLREHHGSRLLVVCNLAPEGRRFQSHRSAGRGTTLVGTLERAGAVEDVSDIDLGPLEGLVVLIEDEAAPRP